MKICIYLVDNRFIDHEVSEEQALEIIKAYDSPSENRIIVSTPTEVYHIAKPHIVAIAFKKDATPTTKLLN